MGSAGSSCIEHTCGGNGENGGNGGKLINYLFSFVDFVAAAAVVAVAGAKKPCSFDSYSRTWTRNLWIVVNCTQHQDCNRLVTIMFSCSGSN